MIKFRGGDGSSKEKAIIILGANSDLEGVEAEYEYLESIYEEQNVEWRLNEQSLFIEDDKYYDVLRIEFRNKKQATFWIDITNFYGLEDD